MKHYKLFFYLLFSLIILNACTSPDSIQQSNNAKKVLVINESEFASSLHPHHAINAINARIVSQIYEGLFRFNAKGDSISLCLASSYTVNSNKTEYTFTIKDALFHKNACFGNTKQRAISAYDFEFSFNQLLKSKSELSLKYIFNDNIADIKSINKKTLKISLNKPDPLFLEKLASPAGYVYPEEASHYYRNRFHLNPVGTGPFYVTKQNSIIENHIITLNKNPHYHIQNKPKLDGVVFRFINDKNTEYEEFLNGNLDIIHHIDSTTWNNFKELSSDRNGDFYFYETQELSLLLLGFNTINTISSNLSFRTAINHALDKSLMQTKISFQKNPFSTTSVSLIKNNYSPNSSLALLQDLEGFQDWEGTILPISITDPTTASAANYIKNVLEKTTNKRLDINALPVLYYERELLNSKESMFYNSFDFLYPNQEQIALSLLNKNKPFPNTSKFDNYDLLKLIENTNPRDSSYSKSLASIINSQLPIIPLTFKTNLSVSQYRIKNLTWNKLPYLDLRNVDIQEPIKTLPIN